MRVPPMMVTSCVWQRSRAVERRLGPVDEPGATPSDRADQAPST